MHEYLDFTSMSITTFRSLCSKPYLVVLMYTYLQDEENNTDCILFRFSSLKLLLISDNRTNNKICVAVSDTVAFILWVASDYGLESRQNCVSGYCGALS